MASPERVSLRYGGTAALKCYCAEDRYALCAAAMDVRPFGRLILPVWPQHAPVLFPCAALSKMNR